MPDLERLLSTDHPALGPVRVLVVLLLAALGLLLVRWAIVRAVRPLAERSESRWDDALLARGVFTRAALLVPAIVAYNLRELLPIAGERLVQIVLAYSTVVVVLVVNGALAAAGDLYGRLEVAKVRPIKGYLQVGQLMVTLAGAVVVVAELLDRSPWAFLSGIGAMTAVLLLIFRDTILSFVASVRISANDIIRVGDWIEMPKFGADGDVVDVALHTIKVQNWDMTITTIPTHLLLEEPVKNWRGMQESGGRRIKRSLFLDQTSVRFLDEADLARLGRSTLLEDYLADKQREIEAWNRERGVDLGVRLNGRRQTNLGAFRAYLSAYLRSLPSIRQDLTLLVRHLQPGAEGLPIEVYCFSADTRWAAYEGIQADIVDHVLAVLPEFDLRVFQRPTGHDVGRGAGGSGGAEA